MVFQRNSPARIYGHGTRGSRVVVSFNNQNYTGAIGENGKFEIAFGTYPAGGPHQIRVTEVSSGQSFTLSNVLFGDVFVCSGQSNMWWTINLSSNPQLEIQESLKFPNVRHFGVATRAVGNPEDDFADGVTTGWLVPSTQHSGGFSAVCWTFGTYLNKRLGIPIGLLHSSVGGSPIEMWMSKEAHAECRGTQPANNYWNGMIYPLLKQKVVGGLWYQGESNAGNSRLYDCQFQSMVKSWRNSFHLSTSMLYLAVQLAGFNGEFREIRNVQFNLATKVPNSGVATAIDLGHPTDIHPKNKRELAMRLELIAANKLYNVNTPYSGPIVNRASLRRDGQKIIVNAQFLNSEGGFDFKNSDNCTTCCQTRNNVFLLYSESNKIYETSANIINDVVLLEAVNVPNTEKITTVRVHWNNFQQCSFINKKTGLAAPSHLFTIAQ